ncbi:MAG: HIT domain-containing protein [Patescibacteria group bacterium]
MAGCIFCEILAGRIPGDRVAEQPGFIVIRDIAPKAPIHLLLISRRHIGSLLETAATDRDLLGDMLSYTRTLAEAQGVAATGYKLVVNTGHGAGQLVPHLHLHFLAGEPIGELP